MASDQNLSLLYPSWAKDASSSSLVRSKNSSQVPDPPGFSSQRAVGGKQRASQPPTRKAPTAEETDTLKLKKSWEIALAPGKQVPMQFIMSYMTGNSLQIFTLMTVFMLFKGPLQAIAATNRTFSRFETESNRANMMLVKLVYIVMQCALLGLGVWKIGKMGLLPTTQSDWVAFETERNCLERASFAL